MPLNDAEREELSIALFDLGLRLCDCNSACLQVCKLGEPYSCPCLVQMDQNLAGQLDLQQDFDRERGCGASPNIQRALRGR